MNPLSIEKAPAPLDVPLGGLDEVARIVLGSEPRVRLLGLPAQAAGFVAAMLLGRVNRSLVVLVRDRKEAFRIAGEIALFLGAAHWPSHNGVRLLTCWEPLWGRRLTVEEDPAMARLKTLASLMYAKPPFVVVATLAGLFQRTLPKDVFDSHSMYLARREEVDREELVTVLAAAGYTRVELVGEPGDMSVRGAVLDVFAPFYDLPLRLEFDGETVESIRSFSPETQRTKAEFEECFITPASEAVLTPETSARARQALYRLGVVRAGTWLMDLEAGGRFPGPEPLLPFLFPALASPLDYLDPDSLLLVAGPESLDRAAKEEHARLHRDILTLAQEKGPGLPMDENLLDPEEVMESLGRLPRVELAEPGDPAGRGDIVNLQLPVRELTDLRAEVARPPGDMSPFGTVVEKIRSWQGRGLDVVVVARNKHRAERLETLLLNHDLAPDTENLKLLAGALSRGFVWPEEGIGVISDEELFPPKTRRVRRQMPKGIFLSSFRDLKPGDPVVHRDFGIGLFRDLRTLEVNHAKGDFLFIEYRDGDRLYVPVDRLRLVQKYLGSGEGVPPLDRLGGKAWERAKKRTRSAVRRLAQELLKLYAARLANPGFSFSGPDELFHEFEESFPFEETPDQMDAVSDVLADMSAPKPMDRLICGDVGFGKTEVAVRAAFSAVFNGKQVAVVVPTTVLAEQHLITLKERFERYPIRVDGLSRLKTKAHQSRVIKELEEGTLDVVIGTHRLLGKDVKFRDLGLVIIDEEHRFGVAHKERLKRLRTQVDVLALSATPIPRTLSLSLSGLRDLSLIETPPLERRAVITEIVKFDKELIRDAVNFELARGGQVFFVHNRVRTIPPVTEMVKELAPDARVGYAHGQMPERELERVMLDFVGKRLDVLVSTSIIESGLDIPAANTLIVDRADRFGLSQLHQIRGRVGRSPVQAYAYLMVPGEDLLSITARKRLKTLIDFTHLGAGFKIALHDLQIRGGGEILGAAQSGHAARVGYELYMDLLEREVRAIKGEEPDEEVEPEIALGVEAMLPESYLPDRGLRLLAYKRLALAKDPDGLKEVAGELTDRYGRVPEPAARLLDIARLKMDMAEIGIVKAEYAKGRVVFTFGPSPRVDPGGLAGMVAGEPRRFRLTPEGKLLCNINDLSPQGRIEEAKKVLLSLKESDKSHPD